MNLRQLTAPVLSAAAAATNFGIAPAQAQFYCYGNDWRAPIQCGHLPRPTQSWDARPWRRPTLSIYDYRDLSQMNKIAIFGHGSPYF